VLSELVIEGVSSNQKMLYMICYNPTFVKGEYHIRFMDQEGASVLYYR
jgi:pyruvate carboxylase